MMKPRVKSRRIGDSTRLRQILVNLIGNAIKFTEQGEVLLEVDQDTQDPRKLLFRVKDTGIGIETLKLKELFQPFSQADSSTSRRFGGSGLGLTISKMLVELMGGKISAESKPGIGSIFQFSILSPIDTATPEPDWNIQWLKGKTVLMLDDNRTHLRVLKALLKKWGIKGFQANSCAEAHKVIQGNQDLDFVILDYRAPGCTGFKFLHQLINLEPRKDYPVILLSTGNPTDILNDARAMGVSAVISKPIRQSQLAQALLAAVGKGHRNIDGRTAVSEMKTLKFPKDVRMLLAEDNPVNQKVSLLLLKRLGFDADLACNGLEVLEAFKKQKYDIILMDVQMPIMDGLCATREIRKNFPPDQQPIILAITAGVTEEDQSEIISVGMDGLIRKPVKIPELVKTLEDALARMNLEKNRIA